MFRYERSPVLEDGEIRDEADEPYSPSDYDAEGIISHISTNSDAQLTSWTSLDEEREVDRIIAEMQGFVHDERANQCGGDDVVDDEESLRRAAIVSAQKRRRQLTQIAASMSEQGAFYKEQTSPTVAQGTSDATLEAVSAVHPRSARHGGSTKSTWVRLDSSRSNAKGGLRRSSMNRVEPLVVTVANDTRRDCGGHLALHGNIPEGELAWSNEYDEALHNIRLRFEQDVATAIEKDVEGGLGDNYEQVGMDIVDSDRDSQSRCAVPRGVPSEADTDVAKRGVADEPSVDDEAERLRAALLEQVMRKKHLEEGAETALNNREEGEVSGSTTPIHSPGVATD
uniref:Pyruvate dehydrogenase phosphatase regulatory subunit n=2 Tax=Parascaris univalens TaxID=6257 RepID=A0A915CEA1_PARUN